MPFCSFRPRAGLVASRQTFARPPPRRCEVGNPDETQLKLFFAFDETDFVERVFLGTRPMDQQPSELRANGASTVLLRGMSPCNRSICRWACSVEPSNEFCNRSSRQLRKV